MNKVRIESKDNKQNKNHKGETKLKINPNDG
jgi:hypothetical protein